MDKKPKLTIDNYTIKTTYGQVIKLSTIVKAELVVKGKWTRYKSNYIKLVFLNKPNIEFPVDNLNVAPKEIQEFLLSKINNT